MKWNVRLLYPLAFLFALGTWAHPADDYDLGWHLLGGEYIAVNHALPTSDFINAFNHPQFVPGSVSTVLPVDTTSLAATSFNQIGLIQNNFGQSENVFSSHPRVVQLALRLTF